MPRGNKTGPMGMGPMTGRGAGLCRGNSLPGFMSSGGGRFGGSGGMGGGYGGRARGFRNRFFATGLLGWLRFPFQGMFNQSDVNESKDDEIQVLKTQAEYLNSSLNEINRRLSEIESHKEAQG